MKNFIQWLKSPKSDFILLIIALVLLNLVCIKAFFRWDLTGPRSYSLSKTSRQIVKTLEEPLAIKVFFSSNLPSPYNSVEQYLNDLLVEYKGSANKNFSYEFFNMEKDENMEIASQYGIKQQQIQEIKDNEVGFKNVYMGMAFIYGDAIEIMDGITDSSGLEYKITTKLGSMINKTGNLAGLKGKVNLTLYATKTLENFGIAGFSKLESIIEQSVEQVNKKNLNKVLFQTVDPSQEQIDVLIEKYGIEPISWEDNNAVLENNKNGRGVICCVIEYEQNFKILPVRLSRGFFGGYAIAGLENFEEVISDSLANLLCRSDKIGYLSGFGTQSLKTARGESSNFALLIDDKYEFVELDLTKEEIPQYVNQIVINGPKQKIDQEVFYKLDQFLMKGGSLTVFADSFEEVPPQNQYSLPVYSSVDSGLDEFLAKYGIEINKNVILDKNCYKQSQSGYGEIRFYYVPVLDSSCMNQKNPISKNLAYVFMCQNSSISFTQPEGSSLKSTVLAKSSGKAWEMKDNIILHPMYITEAEDDLKTDFNLAYLIEGKFTSQYKENDSTEKKSTSGIIKTGTSTHLAKGIQSGKIFVVGSSIITTSMILDESGSTPIAIFLRNVLDYMSGNADLCNMRSKGLSLNTLKISGIASVRVAKIINEYVVPLLVIILGIIIWRMRIKRRKKILKAYSLHGGNDQRETLALEKYATKNKDENKKKTVMEAKNEN
ncbi:MAG: Gldg family protein [Treponemataceae bacterium]